MTYQSHPTRSRGGTLFLLVTTYPLDPRVQEELRFYVGKHPWKVVGLLSSTKRVFKKAIEEADRKAGGQGEEADPDGGGGAQTSPTTRRRAEGEETNMRRNVGEAYGDRA